MSRAPAKKKAAARAKSAPKKSAAQKTTMRVAQWLDSVSNRSFEAAETNRLNKTHWRKALGTDLNADLHADLPTLRARCRHEGQNNPHVVGMCKLLGNHVVGKGPVLRITSSSKAYNQSAERLWKRWSEKAGADGRSLAHHLRGAVRRLPLTGEILWQITNGDDKGMPVKARVNPLNPKYLQTPPGKTEGPSLRMGVEFFANSKRAKTYHYKVYEDGTSTTEKWEEYKAQNILHWFDTEEEGQARGVPWIASSLQGAADLRDMSGSVLRAADAAALLAVLLWTPDGGNAPVTLNSNTDIEPKSMMSLPPGYQATQINPAQPSQNYESFHRGKISEQALPVGMPHVVAALDSSDTSYAGGRIDLQNYGTSVGVIQTELECSIADPLLEGVLREGSLAGALPNAPEDLDWSWVWPTIPHVDPTKQAAAQRMRIETGSLDVVDACAEYGLDADVVTARQESYVQQRDAATIRRISAIIKAIAVEKKTNADFDISWKEVITAQGATIDPTDYLKAANTTLDDGSDSEPVTASPTNKAKGPSRG